MISIGIVILAVVVVGLAFYFRTGIANLMQGLAADAQATWIDFETLVWPAIRATVLVALFASCIPWLLLLIIMGCIGSYANSLPSALVITCLLPFWFLIFIMPSVVRKIRVVNIMGTVFSVILLVAALNLSVGIFSPDIKASWNRWSGDQKQVLANTLHKSSLKSEAEVGVVGVMAEDSAAYDSQNKAVWKIVQGAKVKAMDLSGKPSSQGSEGMTRVMLRNPDGDFIGGNIVYVPSRKINWNG